MIHAVRRILLLVALVALQACSNSNTVLFNALTQEEGNEIYSLLLQVGIPAEKGNNKEGTYIAVPKAMSSEALRILQSKGLPKDKRSSIGQVFKKDGMISSPLEEKARYLYALSQELEQTLMRMDGVLAARVHIVLPEKSNPGEPLSPSSAAVFVKYDPRTSLPAYIPRIRELVFKSIPGILGDQHTSVSVAAVPAENLQENCLPLLWYGPMAIHPDSRWAFLSIGYLLIGLWMLSLAVVWLQAKNIDQWPPFLAQIHQKLFKR